MASASSLPCGELFLCSICLNVFTEPVSTPCGHNYCRTCITGYWSSCDLVRCPLCMKRFNKRPQLQVNTSFRDVVEHFKSMKVRVDNGIVAKPGEVPCDICIGPKLKALKTCLVCSASYCQSHLEPHQRVTTLKKHRLVDPVSNLEDRMCKKHGKMLEFFCRHDLMCVCFMCLKDDHASHHAITLEDAFLEMKAQVDQVTSEMKVKENTKLNNIKKTKQLGEKSKRALEKDMTDIDKVFTSLVVSLQRGQIELHEVIQEKQKAAEKQAEDHVKQLEQEVAELKKRRSEMEQLLETKDYLLLLKSWPSLHFPTEGPLSHSTPTFTPDPSDSSQQSCVEMVKRAIAQMEKTLSNEMQLVIHEAMFDGHDAAKLTADGFVEEVWTHFRCSGCDSGRLLSPSETGGF